MRHLKKEEPHIIMFLPEAVRAGEIRTGGEKYWFELINYFERQGRQVDIVSDDNAPGWPRRFGLVFDCLVSNIWFFWNIKHYRKYKNVVLFEDFHLHPRLVFCNGLMKVVNKDIKIVALVQSSLFYHGALRNRVHRKLDALAVRLFFRQTAKLVCNSDFTRREVVSLGVATEKVEAVYCGFEDFSGEFQCSKDPKETENKLKILFVGHCAACKGLVYLLKALSLLPDNDFVLNIVGNIEVEPAYFKQLNQVMEDLSLEGRVVFHGHIAARRELARYYTETDIFVLPSLAEGFAIVLLEAMSFGLPIVASRAGAIPELVKDGENGLLVPPADPEKLADALKQLLASKELRQRLGDNGRNFCRAHRECYTWDKVGERIMKSLIKEKVLR